MAVFAIAPALAGFPNGRSCWLEPAKTPSSVFARWTIRAASMPWRSLRPNRLARMMTASGKPPRSSMARSGARFAINRSRMCTGKAAPRSFRCVSSSSRRLRIARVRARSCTIAIRRTLLTSDQRSSLKQLLQIYFDRWQIEVNHREEKDTLGVGQAQLWNAISVPKQPVLAVAAYSALLLASLLAFGAERGKAYAELPKWRRKARRPSALDLVTLLRKEMTQQPELLAPLGFQITDQALVGAADA